MADDAAMRSTANSDSVLSVAQNQHAERLTIRLTFPEHMRGEVDEVHLVFVNEFAVCSWFHTSVRRDPWDLFSSYAHRISRIPLPL